MAIIDRDDYKDIRAEAMVFCSLRYTYNDMLRTIAAEYYTTPEEIAAILEGSPIPERPLDALGLVATYVER
ncbi:MAG: hypothetical protein M5U09_12610 [Gammaproteobacteria bacterium]|nr:hypothetical protein [Gammaproteobacteria bacterium]